MQTPEQKCEEDQKKMETVALSLQKAMKGIGKTQD